MSHSSEYARCDGACNENSCGTCFENAAIKSCEACCHTSDCLPKPCKCMPLLCNLAGVQAQMTTGTNVEANKPVLFNKILVGSANIGFTQSTGKFTLLKPGMYVASWTVNVCLKSGTVVKFGIVNAATLIAAVDGYVVRGQVCGSAMIKVTSAPVTVQLMNLTASTVAYDTGCSVLADMEIIKAV